MRLTLVLYFAIISSALAQRSDFNDISFKKADSIAEIYRGENLKNLPVLTHNLTVNLTTDVEKFRAIYTWVSTNIKNDYSSYLKTKSKRRKFANNRDALLEWNNSFTPKVFKNLLEHKKTACSGYAYLVKELANLANINCEIVGGFGRTATLSLENSSLPNHSWNVIELNNKWYVCDATWSAGRIEFNEDNTPYFKSDYNDGYFLADPKLFIKNHYPLDKKWSLLDHTPSYGEFLESPMVYKHAFKPNVIPTSPNKMHFQTTKGLPTAFVLTAEKEIDKNAIMLVLNTGPGQIIVKPNIIQKENTLTLQHTFEKARSYDVHIQIENTIIATYVVKVRK